MKWINTINSKIAAEELQSLDDASLEKCFRYCVAGVELTRLAKEYRDKGLITLNHDKE